MPTLHSHGNTNVSKIWPLIVILVGFMVFVVWKSLNIINDINTINERVTKLEEQL